MNSVTGGRRSPFGSSATLAGRRIKNPRFLLAFPPLQFAPGEMIRPDGTLALPYLHAALARAGFEADILDMSIGTARDDLRDTFYRKVPISDRFVRIGMSAERILEEVSKYDVVALTSIFTQQTSRCFEIARLVKDAFPEKMVIAGGVNARALREHFLDCGFDAVFLSESEAAIVAFALWLHRGEPRLGDVPGISFRENERTCSTPPGPVTRNLDVLPMPSWEKLPNERYWRIARVWGGRDGWMEDDPHPRYAAVLTSRGCPFRCTYCHISGERGGVTGDIGALRVHSVARVEQEFAHLRSMGVTHVYVNDDSFLAKKRRVHAILRAVRRFGFKLADVNGVNIVHLFRRAGRRLVVDRPLLEALHEAGFRKISLPFESGSQRLIDRYSSAKWDLDACDVVDLVRQLNEVGIAADGNFMIGYPDETPEELTRTFALARRVMDAGLIGCQFFMVQPFPGTRLFDDALASGQLKEDWHWDDLGWSKGSLFQRLEIDREVLKCSWKLAWRLLNKSTRVQEFRQQLA